MPKITIHQKPTCTTYRQVYNALKESGVDFEAVDYQLCRYITRPAIANERLKRNRAGQVVLQLKSPYKDGTTHIEDPPVIVKILRHLGLPTRVLLRAPARRGDLFQMI